MARLVSYKSRDESRYSTFGVDNPPASTLNTMSSMENLSKNLNNFPRIINPGEVKRKRKKRRFFDWLKCYCTCCTTITKNLCPCRDPSTRHRGCCTNRCYMCSGSCCGNDECDDDDYNSDGKFARIRYKMSLKELYTPRGSVGGGTTTPPAQKLPALQIDGKQIGGDTQTTPSGSGRWRMKKWNWDDSMRSNSDKFLETLEYDDSDGDKSLKRKLKAAKMRAPNTLSAMGIGSKKEEANAPEVCNSPLIGNRNGNGSASPVASHGSRGSASSDPWPSQSEEDIDRLVALHQNRNSLSSLGLRSDSMASVYSGAGEGRYGTVAVKGQVEFGMQYNYKQSALEIHVVRCKDLAAVDAKRNRSDPYVKVYLLPDKSKSGKRKTKVKKHTLNPIFEETLKFHMPLSSLESRTLWLTVWHSDMFGRNDFLGEVSISLAGKVFDNPQSQWYLLQERSEPFDDVAVYKGDIIVGLKFIPPESSNSSRSLTRGSNSNLRKFGSIKSNSKSLTTKGQLHVLVKEAKNLSPVKASGTVDAFCKSYLLPDKNRSSKQKTPVVKRSVNPCWNYTFIYEDVSLDELSDRALELTVWDHDRLASNEFLGGVRFSLGTGKHYGKAVDWMDATGRELSLWQNMLNRPNFWVEGALILRSSLDGNKALP